MRIALVSKEFAPFQGWGAGTYASLVSAALRDAGHEVHVLTQRAEAATLGPKLRPGVQFHVVDDSLAHLCVPGHLGFASRYSLAVLESLKALHAKHPFDYIEFPDFDGEGYWPLRAREATGEFAGATIGIRLHMTLQDIRPLNQWHWLDFEQAVVAHLENESIARADVLLACSKGILERTRARLGEVGPLRERAFVVHNPFDVDSSLRELGSEQSAEARPKSWAAEDREIVFVGRVERRKGPHVLVDGALALLDAGSPLRVRFIGADTNTGPIESSMIAHLKSRIPAKWSERFVFENSQWPRSHLGPAIRRADVCVLPSLWENFPYACLEAMALGACVIGADAGGMSEIIQHERSGLLAKAGDAQSLAQIIALAIGNDDLQRACARAAPTRVRELCDPTRIAREAVQAIEAARASKSSSINVKSARPSPVDVCVIVPVFDAHSYLSAALDSIAAQTVQPREVVIISDGCTDQAMLAQLKAVETSGKIGSIPCKVVYQQNQGLGAARNAAIEHASASWILPLDSDDVLAPSFIERTLLAADRNPAASFVGTLVARFTQSTSKFEAIYTPLGLDGDLLCVRNIAACAVVLIKKQAILDAGGYARDLVYEDWDLYAAFAERGASCVIVPEVLFYHRTRPGSLMHQVDARKHQLLRTRILDRHPGLAKHAERALRVLAGDLFDLNSASTDPLRVRKVDAHAIAKGIIRENIRYRAADKVNNVLKSLGIQRALKKLFPRRR